VYFCGGFRARGVITTNYDYMSAPFKVLVASSEPKKSFWQKMVEKVTTVVADVGQKVGQAAAQVSEKAEQAVVQAQAVAAKAATIIDQAKPVTGFLTDVKKKFGWRKKRR
jgi:hypothetical protein